MGSASPMSPLRPARPLVGFVSPGRSWVLIGFVWFFALASRSAEAQAPPSPTAWGAEVAPTLAKYCGGCHDAGKAKGGVSLASFGTEAGALTDMKLARRVVEALEGGSMPPDDAPQPTAPEQARLLAQIQSAVSKAGCVPSADPGHVTIRRLNRAEYNNTVRDLLGIDCHLADDFPSDDVGYGFDNIGDVLSLPPLLLEKYLQAAESLAESAIIADDRPRGPTRRYLPTQYGRPKQNGQLEGDTGFWLMFTNAEATLDDALPEAGTYLVRVRAYGHPAGPEPPKLEIKVDGKSAHTVFVKNTAEAPEVFTTRIKVRRPGSRLSVAFTNDAYFPERPEHERDRNLSLGEVDVIGPLYRVPDRLPASHTRIIPKAPGPRDDHRAMARAGLARFATRAYRRPATPKEVERLVDLVARSEANGDRFERGVQVAVMAVLMSPHFLFRVETEQRPAGAPARLLTDLELASRLSYFLWSSMPDDELRDLAARGQLRVGGNLDAQVARLLRDPRSWSLVDNFAAQWLQFRNLKLASPDPSSFPTFDEPLRAAMQREAEVFFAGVLADSRPITDFLHADYTFVNERLARHYGIPGVVGDQFRRVALIDPRRGGVVTMASTLTVTANPTRTSPVKRGKWILEEILGTPPPPAPPGVADLPDLEAGKPEVSVRGRLERHRTQADCAGCHNRLDPLGFALENFDAIGALRNHDGAEPIDPSGTLPDGTSIRGPAELKVVLLSRQAAFARCFAEKLMTYALGRGLEESDRCLVEGIASKAMQEGGQVARFVGGIVHSSAFQATSSLPKGPR